MIPIFHSHLLKNRACQVGAAQLAPCNSWKSSTTADAHSLFQKEKREKGLTPGQTTHIVRQTTFVVIWLEAGNHGETKETRSGAKYGQGGIGCVSIHPETFTDHGS